MGPPKRERRFGTSPTQASEARSTGKRGSGAEYGHWGGISYEDAKKIGESLPLMPGAKSFVLRSRRRNGK